MWHFDTLVRTYKKKIPREIKHIDFSSSQKTFENTEVGSVNPLYEMGMNLRKAKMDFFYHKYQDKPISVFLHLPPLSVSPGSHTWMLNLKCAFLHMGVKVYEGWENLNYNIFKSIDIFIIIGATNFLNRIEWDKIKELKKKLPFHIISQANFDVGKEGAAVQYLDYCEQFPIDYFFSFDHASFNIKSGLEELFFQYKKPLFSFPFSANPILHYPVKFTNPKYDYIFIGTAQYDKIGRYNRFFPSLIKHYDGIIVGPGWPWCKDFVYNEARDRYLYSLSKVAINLHLEGQVQDKRQLNERYYILGAMGIPQFSDLNLDYTQKDASSIDLLSNFISFDSLYTKWENQHTTLSETTALLQYIYSTETTFDRIESMLKFINN